MCEFSRFRHSCVLLLVVLGLSAGISYGFGTFGFYIHHRYSDPVKEFLAIDELPVKESPEYYTAMVHRDRIIKGCHLAMANDRTPVTFLDGNETYRLNSLGFLHYANVSVGKPALSFLVALDTGSDLFWLPCDCSSCVQGIGTPGGPSIEFNIYSPNTSSTSSKVSCNSPMCEHHRRCSSPSNFCPYQVDYLSDGTSSTGVLVEDVLHLTTDDDETKPVEARITFGCGKVQTGSFLNGAAPNGLFGLGLDNISVPSILANEKLASNSFSLCFGHDGVGRITFGDKGSSDQGESPLNLMQSHPSYNVSITQIKVGGSAGDLEFNAIFDSGTSFTYLNDPAYTLISESFNNLAREKRFTSNNSSNDLPFEYCYELSANQTSFEYPVLNLTMKGGDRFFVQDPIVVFHLRGGGLYCLGVVKSDSVNIIGQNFMTGYHIVFDREKMVLGWKASNCYDIEASNTLPVIPPSAVPPATAVNPEATAGNSNNGGVPGASPPMTNQSTLLKALPYGLAMALILYSTLI
ncbi:aspartyl protease family protein 1-like isoform X2 [Hibiscus syriacus]|uniref:aspartyl protease family protein 1-like isoform X2 n=1 Tax=Hibiscus syriacus TaxID=106335 RepID=UPI001920ECA3|nr:aspartyl protease family protein 1-like isoform X2 [Hibiscus syriacus]